MFHTIIFSVFFLSVADGLQWNSHSLLQPGPCPNSITVPAFDVQQLKGQWAIEQVSPLFPRCCRRPVLEFIDVPVQLMPKTNNTNENWIKAALNWSPCLENEPDNWIQSFSARLWQNSISPGTFLMELPWPFNLAGFGTFSVISTDHKTYAAAYICHSLLLEHILIPMTIVRPNVKLDPTEVQRLKWALVKQGVLSAWDLTNIVGAECNDLTVTEASNETLTTPAYSPHTEKVINVNHSEPNSPRDGFNITQTPPGSEGPTIDPDSEVEWITTESSEDYPIQFPDGMDYPIRGQLPRPDPGFSHLWPSIIKGGNSPKESPIE